MQKKKVLSLVLTLAMVLGLFAAMPLAVGAAPPDTNTSWDFSGKPDETNIAYGGGSYSWESGTRTLTLNGVSHSTGAAYALTLPPDSAIVLIGANAVTSTFSGDAMSRGINMSGNLTIGGNGSLIVTSGSPTTAVASSGVYLNGGNLTIRDTANVTFTSAAVSPAFGYAALSATLILNGGTVTAIGSFQALSKSYTVPDGYKYYVNTTTDPSTAERTGNGVTYVFTQKYVKIVYAEKWDTAPTITTHPKDLTVEVGGNIPFSVVASGNNCSYSWELSNNNGASWLVLAEQGVNPSQETPSLLFTNAQSNWNGFRYRCVVSNSAGSVTSNAATLTVSAAHVAVSDITGTPTAAVAGTPLTLTGTVAPGTATNKTITWSVKSAGTTGAAISGNIFNATAAGTATITATVANGATATTPYTKDFDITVTADFDITVTAGTDITVNPGGDPIITGPASTPFPFTDVATTAWYYDDVKIAYEMGLINGKTPTTFAPDANLTYAEAVKLAACMHQFYMTDSVTLVNGSPIWYDSYVDYAKVSSIISKDYSWSAQATRAGYMEIFANALPASALAAMNTIQDGSIPDVPATHPQAAAIYKLYRAGILQGVDAAHNCNPNSNIKRSEVAAILTRMMNDTARISFSI